MRRVVDALRAQSLSADCWELLVVDNASTRSEAFAQIDCAWNPAHRLVREPTPGLTFARLRGIVESAAEAMVFVDDDNVLAPDYLENVLAILDSHPRLGAAGGRVIPEFEKTPPSWVRQFDKALALRDLGGEVLVAPPFGGAPSSYPECAPIGAGLVLRREPALHYAETIRTRAGRVITDRTGNRLSSGGDNDLVLTVLENGWEAGYFPHLVLTHLIPASRCTRAYLARLLRESHRSWFAVLDAHGLRPRRPIPPILVPALKMRAWFQLHAWRGPAEHLRWQDRCGEIEGRSNLR